jgi:hypothetical protein
MRALVMEVNFGGVWEMNVAPRWFGQGVVFDGAAVD